MRRPGGERRPNAPADAEARAEDLYKRMRASVDRMKAQTAQLGENHQTWALLDIRELLLHVVELVALSAEEDQ